jgi:hypothetical protein
MDDINDDIKSLTNLRALTVYCPPYEDVRDRMRSLEYIQLQPDAVSPLKNLTALGFSRLTLQKDSYREIIRVIGSSMPHVSTLALHDDLDLVTYVDFGAVAGQLTALSLKRSYVSDGVWFVNQLSTMVNLHHLSINQLNVAELTQPANEIHLPHLRSLDVCSTTSIWDYLCGSHLMELERLAVSAIDYHAIQTHIGRFPKLEYLSLYAKAPIDTASITIPVPCLKHINFTACSDYTKLTNGKSIQSYFVPRNVRKLMPVDVVNRLRTAEDLLRPIPIEMFPTTCFNATFPFIAADDRVATLWNQTRTVIDMEKDDDEYIDIKSEASEEDDDILCLVDSESDSWSSSSLSSDSVSSYYSSVNQLRSVPPRRRTRSSSFPLSPRALRSKRRRPDVRSINHRLNTKNEEASFCPSSDDDPSDDYGSDDETAAWQYKRRKIAFSSDYSEDSSW